MSDQLPDIYVVGQRASSSGGGFPPQPRSPDDYPPHQNGGSGRPTNPCENPVTALEWNADAAAAKEFARLAALAGENGLNYRERGAYMIQRPDGSIGFGPVHTSEPFENGDAAVHLTYEGIDPSWIIGSIHSHPAGSHLPSGPSPRPEIGLGDVGHFAGVQAVMDGYGRDSSMARIYIVAQNQLGAGQTPYNQINVYNETNITASQIGPEVNPNGLSCP